MSEAPQRIGLISDGFGNWALAHRDEVDTAVHYIRADLAPSPAPDVREAVLGLLTALNSTEGRARQAEAERDELREALRRLLSSPAISDGDQADPEWGCSETYAAEINARAALNREAGT